MCSERDEQQRPQIGTIQDSIDAEPELDLTQDTHKEIPGCGCEKCRETRRQRRNNGKWVGYDYIDPKEVKSLAPIGIAAGESENHCYLLCSRRLMGFILKSRKWGESIVYPSKPRLKPDLTVYTKCRASRRGMLQ